MNGDTVIIPEFESPHGECWECADTVPPHATDKRFCSHECALDWTDDA